MKGLCQVLPVVLDNDMPINIQDGRKGIKRKLFVIPTLNEHTFPLSFNKEAS